MLRKLMEAEEKKDAAAEEPSPAETPETPAEAPAEETPAEAPAEAEEAPKDESEETAKKIEDLSKKQVVDDYDLTKQLKSLYEPILNADTLKEKSKAIKNYQKVINNLAKKSEKNDKVKDALIKTREFIMADSKRLASLLFRKLKK